MGTSWRCNNRLKMNTSWQVSPSATIHTLVKEVKWCNLEVRDTACVLWGPVTSNFQGWARDDMFPTMITLHSAVQDVTGTSACHWDLSHNLTPKHSNPDFCLMMTMNPPKFSFYLLSEWCWKTWSAPYEIITNQWHKNSSVQFFSTSSHERSSQCHYRLIKPHSKWGLLICAGNASCHVAPA